LKHSVTVYQYALGIVLILVIIGFVVKQKYPSFFEASSRTVRALIKNQMGLRTLPSWQPIGDGVDVLTLTSETENIPSGTNLFFIRFNSEKIRTFVLHDKGLSTAEQMAKELSALAVINASFFRPEGQPIGLMIQEGKITNRMPTRGLLDSGIFCIKNGRPYIIHRNYFQPSGVSEAIQSFPRLIHNGAMVTQVAESDKRKRRSGIAIDTEGRIIIFISDTNLGGVKFREIQKILLKPNLNVRSALALDGGGSSQLYVNYNQFTKVIHGMTEAPVFLGFFLK